MRETMRIVVVYTDTKTGLEKKDIIENMYWFKEEMVQTLEPQYVNGYGNVRFEILREGLFGVSYQDWMNIS